MSFGQERRIFTVGKFSTKAVFTLAHGTITINGVFDDAFYDATTGENHLETSLPRLTVMIADAAWITREMMATIGGKNYSVLQVQPDLGTGLAVVTFAHED